MLLIDISSKTTTDKLHLQPGPSILRYLRILIQHFPESRGNLEVELGFLLRERQVVLQSAGYRVSC